MTRQSTSTEETQWVGEAAHTEQPNTPAKVVLALSPTSGSEEFENWWNGSTFSNPEFTSQDKSLARIVFTAAINIATAKLLDLNQ